jgi:hypothetical protein
VPAASRRDPNVRYTDPLSSNSAANPCGPIGVDPCRYVRDRASWRGAHHNCRRWFPEPDWPHDGTRRREAEDSVPCSTLGPTSTSLAAPSDVSPTRSSNRRPPDAHLPSSPSPLVGRDARTAAVRQAARAVLLADAFATSVPHALPDDAREMASIPPDHAAARSRPSSVQRRARQGPVRGGGWRWMPFGGCRPKVLTSQAVYARIAVGLG